MDSIPNVLQVDGGNAKLLVESRVELPTSQNTIFHIVATYYLLFTSIHSYLWQFYFSLCEL